MRLMTEADLDAVLSIEQSVQPYPWTRGNFRDAMASGYRCYVDEAEGEVRGFAVLMLGVDEAEVLNIAVAAAHQHKGLGRAMLAAMLTGEPQWSRIFLEVRASNLAAIALYRSAGFEQVGLRRNYYHNAQGSVDALVMARDSSSRPEAGERLGERANG